jgi:N-glycosylase/DNA lyase
MKLFTITSEDIKQSKKACTKFNGLMSNEDRFYELCFVLCAPQAKIESNLVLNKKLRDLDFYHKKVDKKDLVELCKLVRFKNRKAQYLLEAWKDMWIVEAINRIYDKKCTKEKDIPQIYLDLRRHLVHEFKGLSYKTASQFLRNAYGVQDLAILDVYVLRWIGVKKPPTTYKSYEKIEKNFQFKAYKLCLSPAELDSIIFVKSSGIPWEQLR